jgi:hypothetical protein
MAQKYRYKVRIYSGQQYWSDEICNEGFILEKKIGRMCAEYHVLFQGKTYSFYNRLANDIAKEMNQIFLNETRKQKLSHIDQTV